MRDTEADSLFWAYCKRATIGARMRARHASLPCELDAYAIDKLLRDQRWRCAVSNIQLSTPNPAVRDPFGPSVDRIIPKSGYVIGNVRVVCNIVNYAMNQWGAEALYRLVGEMRGNRRTIECHAKVAAQKLRALARERNGGAWVL